MNKGTQIRRKSFCLSTRSAHSFSAALPLSRPLCFIAWMKLLHHYYLFIVMIALYCSQRYCGDLLRFIADNISASKLHTIENNVWHGSNLRNVLPTFIYRSNSSRTRISRSNALNSSHRHTVCAECQKTWFAKISGQCEKCVALFKACRVYPEVILEYFSFQQNICKVRRSFSN